MTDPLTLAAAVIVGTLATARAIRLITADAYPPMVWVRDRWKVWQANRDLQDDPTASGHEKDGIGHGWGPLLTCPFCAAPYVVAVDLAWALWSGAPWGDGGHGLLLDLTWASAWWVVNLWAAVSYVAAMIVVRDEPPAEEE